MKILCTNYEYPPIGGGGAAACKGLAEALVERGNDIDVVTSGMKDLPVYAEVAGVRLHRVPCFRRHRHYTTIPEMVTQVLPAYRKALQLMGTNRYTINHTHFIFPTGLTSYLLWRKTGLPYVITAHGSDVPGYNPDRFKLAHVFLHPLWKEVLRNAACITAASHFLKQLLEGLVDAPIEVIPYGIDFPILPRRPKQDRILVVTRMFERKGVQFLLKALRNFNSHWEVCIAGDGPYLPELRKLAKEIPSAVKFLGFVRGPQLWDLYQSAKVFVFPSIQENFPVVLLEAMHAGCAIITTTAAGCNEVVQQAAIKVRPKSADELGNALHQLLHDENETDRLSRLSRARAATFSSKVVAGTHEKIFVRYGQ